LSAQPTASPAWTDARLAVLPAPRYIYTTPLPYLYTSLRSSLLAATLDSARGKFSFFCFIHASVTSCDYANQ
jgi:hypothetical protein